MMANPQMIWSQGDQVEVMVTLTAHHKGHFVFSGCPIANTTTVPTAECFESHRLTLVRDVYYGAPIDPSHPERVYVAPSTIKSRVYPDVTSEYRDAMLFSYVLQLPPDLVGELVLIQWYYVASNSGCVHEGYAEYDFPREWIVSLDEEGGGKVEEPSDWEVKWGVGTGLKSCEEVLPEDGVSGLCSLCEFLGSCVCFMSLNSIAIIWEYLFFFTTTCFAFHNNNIIHLILQHNDMQSQ